MFTPVPHRLMQRPTLENVRIRSTRDALHVFNAVARNILPLITRRLDSDERRSIVAGNVYIWEERNSSTENIGIGMERWTDGMGWGPSRVRDEFLFYHQKESDEEDPNNPVTPLTLLLRKREVPARYSRNGSSSSVPQEPERLIKQTYSVHVSLPADRSRGILRKWHLTAYFSQERLDSLATIDTIRGVGDVAVPEGLFRSARASKSRRDYGDLPVQQTSHNARSAVPLTPHGMYPSMGASHSSLPYGSMLPASATSSATASSLSPSPSPMSPAHSPSSSVHGLVPLAYLENMSRPRRDPADEQLLRRFAGSTNSHSGPSNHHRSAS